MEKKKANYGGKGTTIPPDKLKLYDKLIAAFPAIERRGATMPYASMNGNMFTFLNGDGSMALRLPAEEREKFMKKYETALFVAHGVVMKEYVKVPDALLKKTAELKKYLALSFDYAKKLKPKPATGKKKET